MLKLGINNEIATEVKAENAGVLICLGKMCDVGTFLLCEKIYIVYWASGGILPATLRSDASLLPS